MTTLPFAGTAPTRAHEGDAGLDLRAQETVILDPGMRMLVGTGTRVALPPGTVGLVCPRSGLAASGVVPLNSPGIVDAGYRGEILVNLINHGDQRVAIAAGNRIAQLVIVPCLILEPVETADLGTTDRGAGGHGSTGR